jgi:C4-dicarboxylate-specific signal transduction histidine kinase
MQQVVLNLIMNAIEAMNGNDENRRSWSSPRPKTGCARADRFGILARADEATPARLFDAFYTPSPTAWNGTRISRTIIEAHGGQLYDEQSTPGGDLSSEVTDRHRGGVNDANPAPAWRLSAEGGS